MRILKNIKWYEWFILLFSIAATVTQVYFEMELIEKMAELIQKVRTVQAVAAIWQPGKWMLIYSAIILSCA